MSVDGRVIRTARLELRPPVVDDAQALLDAYASDPRVTKYMDWRPVKHVSEIADRLAAFVADTADGKCVGWVLRELDETAPCGRVDLRLSGQEGDVGYVLAASKWGQGLMTEALTAVLEFARGHLPLRRVCGTCDPENRASVRVFQKCGFKYVGYREGALLRPNLSNEPRGSDCFEIWLAE
ncbi:MAG TPA: GNAT family N-acetyltransferase [Candidatus Cybelea sp.]|nr:GNAT family N-acetyltransferase [Candidatus Cybelea sp.]